MLSHCDLADISCISITQSNSVHQGMPSLLGAHFSINGNITPECWDPSPTISLHIPLCPLLVRLDRQEAEETRKNQAGWEFLKRSQTCPTHISRKLILHSMLTLEALCSCYSKMSFHFLLFICLGVPALDLLPWWPLSQCSQADQVNNNQLPWLFWLNCTLLNGEF